MEANPNASWIPIGLTLFIVLATWLANCILLGGALQTASSGRIVPVAYFFIGSQAIAALLYVTLNLPPAVVGLLFGSTHIQSHIHVFCLYSTYLDTLFCNLTFLQTFFSSLDAYLRLRNPTFYLTSARRRPALWLKVGSPWLVAALQAIGQLALSDREQVSLHFSSQVSSNGNTPTISSLQTTCLLPDPNFLIIRTAIAYALPLIICIILVGLQLRCLRRLRNYPYEALEALLKVRNGISGIRSLPRQSSTHETLTSDGHHKSKRYANSSQLIFLRDNADFKNTQTNGPRSQVGGIANETRPLTQSLHIERQYTFETLVPEGTLSTQQLQLNSSQLLTQSSISHVLLPTNTLPFFELRAIDPNDVGTDIMYATNPTSVHNCPTHGPVSVTMTGESANRSNLEEGLASADQRIQSSGNETHTESTCGDTKNITVKKLNKENNFTSVDGPNSSKLTTAHIPSLNTEQQADASLGEPIDFDMSTVQRPILKSNSNYSMPTSYTLRSSTHENTLSIGKTDNQLRFNSSTSDKPAREDIPGSATPLWLTAYHGEQLVVAINLVSCIIAVGTWSPFILSTLAHGLCQPLKIPLFPNSVPPRPVYTMHPSLLNLPSSNPPSRCVIQVTPDRIADFRWWAYASMGLLLPCLLFFLDLGLREGCWKALRYTDNTQSRQGTDRRQKPFGQTNALQAINTKQTYRCSDSRSNRNIPTTKSGNKENDDTIRMDDLWNKRNEEQTDSMPIDSVQKPSTAGSFS